MPYRTGGVNHTGEVIKWVGNDYHIELCSGPCTAFIFGEDSTNHLSFSTSKCDMTKILNISKIGLFYALSYQQSDTLINKPAGVDNYFNSFVMLFLVV